MEGAIHFTLLLLLALAAAASRLAGAFDFEEATIASIQAAFDDGSLTSFQLVRHYMDRISSDNPRLHAVLEVNPDALADAARADSQRATIFAANRSLLHGIPILIKDNIATRDRLNTTSGSFALLGSVVLRDAGAIARLRSAGAIILGKATMSEWDSFRSLFSPQGWSPRGGQGQNPYPGTNGPCGTSSGSAIAVAANLVTVALGTDLDGAITCPASVNSVVGIKPTAGLVSRSGVIPISRRLDTVGPMARTVSDAVAVLDAIAGFDVLDMAATWAAERFIPAGGFRQFLNVDGLKGKRIGIFSSRVTNDSLDAKTMITHSEVMQQNGAILISNLEMKAFEDSINQTRSGEATVLLAEFKISIEEYLRDLVSSPVRTLADIIAFNNEHKNEERIDEYGQIIFLASEKTNGLGEAEKEAIYNMIRLSKEGMEGLMKYNNLDAVVFTNDVVDHVLAIGGFPIISVPAGYAESGAPFGISFSGLVGSDAKLIEISYAFEQATRARKPPPRLS